MALRSFSLGRSPSATIAAVAVGLERWPLAGSVTALTFLASKYLRDTLCTGTLGDRKHLGLGRRQHQFKIGPSKGIGLVFELTSWESLHLFEEFGHIGPVYHKEVPVAHLGGLLDLGCGVGFTEPPVR
jgi:hypothetical protein